MCDLAETKKLMSKNTLSVTTTDEENFVKYPRHNYDSLKNDKIDSISDILYHFRTENESEHSHENLNFLATEESEP